MSPWIILAWVASIAISLVIISVSLAVVIASIRAMGRRGKTHIYRGKDTQK